MSQTKQQGQKRKANDSPEPNHEQSSVKRSRSELNLEQLSVFPAKFSLDVESTNQAFRQLVASQTLLSVLDSQSTLTVAEKVHAYKNALNAKNSINLLDLHTQEATTGDTLMMRIIQLRYDIDEDSPSNGVFTSVQSIIKCLMRTDCFRLHVNRTNMKGQTVLNFQFNLLFAEDVGDVAYTWTRELLSAGADVNHTDPVFSMQTPLLRIASSINTHPSAFMMLHLLEHGAHIDARDNDEFSE